MEPTTTTTSTSRHKKLQLDLTDIYCDGPVSRLLWWRWWYWWCEAREEYLVQIAAVSPVSDQPVEPPPVPGDGMLVCSDVSMCCYNVTQAQSYHLMLQVVCQCWSRCCHLNPVCSCVSLPRALSQNYPTTTTTTTDCTYWHNTPEKQGWAIHPIIIIISAKIKMVLRSSGHTCYQYIINTTVYISWSARCT